MSTLGERILEIRTALNLSQAKFGERVQVKASHISNIEQNKKVPSNLLLKAIINEFKVDANWLETGNGPMYNNNYLQVAREKLHETYDDIKSRYADSAIQIASWRSDMLQKIENNIYAAYYEISDCPLVQEDECHLANEMVTYILYSWATSSEYDRIKLEGKFEMIFPNFRQNIRDVRARVIEENKTYGRAVPHIDKENYQLNL